MGKVWVLDTETKGTGAQMVPLEKVLKSAEPKADPAPKPRNRHARAADKPDPIRIARESGRLRKRPERSSGPLPAGHVRKKATGEIGRVQSVDPKAGTASVLWLRQGRTSTVRLTAISRR
jgi:hypothetical protein